MMENKNKLKRSGFTLVEIAIAVFIVAILVLITVPVIKRQLEKADEYSYYLAYKTVEKMAGQIVAMGDPEEINDINTTTLNVPETKFADKIKDSFNTFIADNRKKAGIFLTTAGSKFAKTEEYMFRKMFPKAFADTIKTQSYHLSSDEYDSIWLPLYVCSKTDGSSGINKKSTTTTDSQGNETTTYEVYKHSDFNNCLGYGKSGTTSSGTTVSQYYYLENVLPSYCPNLDISTMASAIAGQSSPNAHSFASTFSSQCSGTDTRNNTTYTYTTTYEPTGSVGDDDDDDDDSGSGDVNVDTPETPEAVEGTLIQYEEYTVTTSAAGSAASGSKKPEFSADYCNLYKGTKNMTNDGAPDYIDCVCDSSHPVVSQNEDRVCCAACTDTGAVPYYNSLASGTAGQCVCCSTDFNPQTGTCCPSNSVYVDGDTCTCIAGYGPEGVCSEVTSCPAGTTLDSVEKVCVVNPPVTRASRLCELITDSYNIYSSACSAGFTGSTPNYNQDVYKAAVSTSNNRYLSIASNTGAFLSLTPNIVFSNGLPMWILADKAASIPGLTYTTDYITSTQNLCINLKQHTQANCYAADSQAYFCKAENTCFTLDSASLTTMGDARNCCAATDLSTLATATQTSTTYASDDYKKDKRTYAIGGFTVFIDINGQDKGPGTLWEDVFPFYLGADGTVYPAYPLDAPKGDTETSNSLYLGGNSEKLLAVDVYYYESTDSAQKKVTAFPNVSYARGVCSARLISKYSPYCLNLGEKYTNDSTGAGSTYISDDNSSTSSNPCDTNKCYISVKQKIKSF